VATAVCLLLAGTLAWAGFAKLADPAPFRVTMRSLGAERLAPAVPVAELAVAALLVAAPPVGAALALALLAVFTFALSRLEVPCHCFGATTRDDGRARNALLAAGALYVLLRSAGAVWTVQAGELAGAATVAAGLACVWQLGTALR
jgi:hypothetical protein